MEDKPPIRYRKLRIAWSVAWGVVVILLCVLSSRGHSAPGFANWYVTTAQGIHVASKDGWATIAYFDDELRGIAGGDMPYWLLLAGAMAFVGLPWVGQLRSRFSLRTLLIAMTLVAVGLGILALSN